MAPNDFAELMRRVRAGDQQAAAELVRQHEPYIQTEIRMWLKKRDPRLRRTFDSMDVCQSVLASFFYRAAAGQYDLNDAQQLRDLLVRMAQHKLADQVKFQQRRRRDVRQAQSLGPEHLDISGKDDSPSQQVADKELFQEVRNRLTEEERQVADLRGQGWEWTAIAGAMGGTADGRRKQLTRALDRVMQDLGLEGPNQE